MAAHKKTRTDAAKESGTPVEVPSLFRINVEVGDLDEAERFYGKLFGLVGRKQAGSRCYFTCGPVTLQVVDVSSVRTPHPAAKALYFVVNDLDAIFERALYSALAFLMAAGQVLQAPMRRSLPGLAVKGL